MNKAIAIGALVVLTGLLCGQSAPSGCSASSDATAVAEFICSSAATTQASGLALSNAEATALASVVFRSGKYRRLARNATCPGFARSIPATPFDCW